MFAIAAKIWLIDGEIGREGQLRLPEWQKSGFFERKRSISGGSASDQNCHCKNDIE